MKFKVVFIWLIFVFSGFNMVFSQNSDDDTIGVKWLDFQSAMDKFMQKQKPVFIWFYSDDCDSCKIMVDSVFGLEEVANYINVLTYPIRVNAETYDTLTFFDGKRFAHRQGQKYHDLVYALVGKNPKFPAIVYFNREAQGMLFQGFRDRDHLFPILIYNTENIYKSTQYNDWEKYYLKAYPPGRKQVITRLIIKWKTWDEMLKLQKQQPRKILVDLYNNYNVAATMMRTTTYNNPVIANYVNKNFYAVTIYAKTADTIDFKGQKFVKDEKNYGYNQFVIAALEGKMQFPAFIILDEDLNLLDRIQVYLTPEAIEPILKFYGSNAYKKMKYPEFLKTFKSGFAKDDKDERKQ